MTRRFVVGISGASGAVYAVRLVELLARGGAEVALTVTRDGLALLADEAGLAFDGARPALDRLWPQATAARSLTYYPADDMRSPIASGSCPTDGMVICPASLNTLGAVAGGLASNLLQRAAQVTLKERRPLVVVPRETPLAANHLENLVRLAHAGAVILPACPAFYGRPQRVADLVDFVVARILNVLGAPHDLAVHWSPDGDPRR